MAAAFLSNPAGEVNAGIKAPALDLFWEEPVAFGDVGEGSRVSSTGYADVPELEESNDARFTVTTSEPRALRSSGPVSTDANMPYTAWFAGIYSSEDGTGSELIFCEESNDDNWWGFLTCSDVLSMEPVLE